MRVCMRALCAQVAQTLRRVGKLQLAEGVLQPTLVGCSSTLAYRNKMVFHFSSKCWQGAAEGPVEARWGLGKAERRLYRCCSRAPGACLCMGL